jgi:RimJ/RimL family protein N-acetyltransferase
MSSEEVRLRPVREADLWLFELMAVDPEANGQFNWSGFRDASQVRRQFEQDGCLNQSGGRLVITEGDLAAGNVGWLKATYGSPNWYGWNLGITLLPEYRGRGIGTAAQGLLVSYLFDTTTAERLEAYTDVANLAEQRSLEKLGFTREGRLRSVQFRGGRWCDLYLYSVIRYDRICQSASAEVTKP